MRRGSTTKAEKTSEADEVKALWHHTDSGEEEVVRSSKDLERQDFRQIF